jgi:hypothetical protein
LCRKGLLCRRGDGTFAFAQPLVRATILREPPTAAPGRVQAQTARSWWDDAATSDPTARPVPTTDPVRAPAPPQPRPAAPSGARSAPSHRPGEDYRPQPVASGAARAGRRWVVPHRVTSRPCRCAGLTSSAAGAGGTDPFLGSPSGRAPPRT